MANTDLFDSALIDQQVKDSLPASYHVRPLSRNDYSAGFFQCLHSLTQTGEVTEDRFLQQFDWMKDKAEIFYNVVIEHESSIVANGMLIVERKFIWDLGKVGHIEEVVVVKDHQGQGLGKRVIQALDSIARNVGCLKTELNCSEENVGFYEKCGYEEASVQMKHEFEGMKKWESDED